MMRESFFVVAGKYFRSESVARIDENIFENSQHLTQRMQIFQSEKNKNISTEIYI